MFEKLFFTLLMRGRPAYTFPEEFPDLKGGFYTVAKKKKRYLHVMEDIRRRGLSRRRSQVTKEVATKDHHNPTIHCSLNHSGVRGTRGTAQKGRGR